MGFRADGSLAEGIPRLLIPPTTPTQQRHVALAAARHALRAEPDNPKAALRELLDMLGITEHPEQRTT